MSEKFIVNQDVTPEECPWLDHIIVKGTLVYRYSGPTYGCIGSGTAVTLEDGKTHFFEVPRAAISVASTVVGDNEAAIALGAAVLTRIEDPAVREAAIRNALRAALASSQEKNG